MSDDPFRTYIVHNHKEDSGACYECQMLKVIYLPKTSMVQVISVLDVFTLTHLDILNMHCMIEMRSLKTGEWTSVIPTPVPFTNEPSSDDTNVYATIDVSLGRIHICFPLSIVVDQLDFISGVCTWMSTNLLEECERMERHHLRKLTSLRKELVSLNSKLSLIKTKMDAQFRMHIRGTLTLKREHTTRIFTTSHILTNGTLVIDSEKATFDFDIWKCVVPIVDIDHPIKCIQIFFEYRFDPDTQWNALDSEHIELIDAFASSAQKMIKVSRNNMRVVAKKMKLKHDKDNYYLSNIALKLFILRSNNTDMYDKLRAQHVHETLLNNEYNHTTSELRLLMDRCEKSHSALQQSRIDIHDLRSSLVLLKQL